MKFEPISYDDDTERALPADIRELRRFMRRHIKAEGWMRVGRRRYIVRLRNLSEQGCQIWLPLRAGLVAGTEISLYIESMGPFAARVRWHREGWAGVEFDIPVYPPVLAHIHDSFDASAAPD